MSKRDSSGDPQRPVTQDVSGQVFSSEKREDIWALLIAAAIFVLSAVFPEQVHSFFSGVLVLF